MDIKRIVLDTLDRVNRQLESDPNALISSREGTADPEAAYIELVRELLKLIP